MQQSVESPVGLLGGGGSVLLSLMPIPEAGFVNHIS